MLLKIKIFVLLIGTNNISENAIQASDFKISKPRSALLQFAVTSSLPGLSLQQNPTPCIFFMFYIILLKTKPNTLLVLCIILTDTNLLSH